MLGLQRPSPELVTSYLAEQSPEPSRVAESVYWAARDGVVVGRIALRHHLSERLAELGGHVGYEVRPCFR